MREKNEYKLMLLCFECRARSRTFPTPKHLELLTFQGVNGSETLTAHGVKDSQIILRGIGIVVAVNGEGRVLVTKMGFGT